MLLCQFLVLAGIGFGCTYYYVLGVPYSCGVVLVFLVLAGNSFWCSYVLSVQYSCAVVSVFLFGGKTNLVLLTLFYSTLLALTD